MEQPDDLLAITGWGIISPCGTGREAFRNAFAAKTRGEKHVTAEPGWHLPFSTASVASDFDAAAILGPKGTRSMDRTTRLAVAATRMALDHSGLDPAAEPGRVGTVLGTSTGSIRSISEFTRETLIQERPYLVNPALFPNTVMNCAAGQCAIWHKVKGVNATISGGHLSALLALRYASLTIRRGYSDALVVGAVEEFCPQAAWAYHHMIPEQQRQQRPLGEGCAAFVLERASVAVAKGRRVLAEVAACETGVYAGNNGSKRTVQAEGLARCIRRALERAGAGVQDEVKAVSMAGRAVPELDFIENAGLEMALGPQHPASRFAISELTGECFSASGALQLAALLACFEQSGTGGVGLVIGASSDGMVGCAVIRSRYQ